MNKIKYQYYKQTPITHFYYVDKYYRSDFFVLKLCLKSLKNYTQNILKNK